MSKMRTAIRVPVCRKGCKHPSIKVLPVELLTMRRQIGIITRKNRTLSSLVQ